MLRTLVHFPVNRVTSATLVLSASRLSSVHLTCRAIEGHQSTAHPLKQLGDSVRKKDCGWTLSLLLLLQMMLWLVCACLALRQAAGMTTLSPRKETSVSVASLMKPSQVKMHSDWDGDCIDVVVGASVGGVAGTLFSVTLARLASAIKYAGPTVLLASAVLKVAEAQGFVTVHSQEIRKTICRGLEKLLALPILRRLDDCGRRREGNLHEVDRIEEIVTRNQHAVAGAVVGFIFGVLRGAQL